MPTTETSDGEQPELVGTAEELDIPVFDPIDPSEVEIFADGSHAGPPKHKYHHGEFVKGYDECKWTAVSVYCPCGHYLRDSHAGRQCNDLSWNHVSCSGMLDLPSMEDEPPIRTEQTNLIRASGGEAADTKNTDSNHE